MHKPLKVLAPKGKRCVSSATSAKRSQTTTILTGYCGPGVYVPPMMIFKRKRNKPELVDHVPPGTLAQCSPNGWIDAGLFLEYLKHFVSHIKCSKDSTVLLILDGHKTHTKSLPTIDYAREIGIVVVSLPPHTSHKLQPLGRSFFKPLKAAFNSACSSFLRNHPGRRITVDQLGELFNTVYVKATTVENAISGFKCTGIIPLNPDVLPESEFLEDPRETPENVQPPTPNTVSCNNHEEIPSAESSSTTLIPTMSPTVHDEVPVKANPTNVSFSDIQKVPCIPERKK